MTQMSFSCAEYASKKKLTRRGPLEAHAPELRPKRGSAWRDTPKPADNAE
jgi:hypothetical protein